MSRRSDDDLDALLDDLSGTLDRLRSELDEERAGDRRRERPVDDRRRTRRADRDRPSIPGPGRFLRFTEEYTIPALIAFLEANIRALELLQGLLRLLDRGETTERRVESVGRRTLDGVDDLLSDVQGAIEGRPSDDRARDLLDEARSLRAEIDDRVAGGDGITRRGRADRSRDRPSDRSRREDADAGRSRDAPVTIDVRDTDGEDGDDRSDDSEADGGRERGAGRRDEDAERRDDVDVDSELDSLRRQIRGDGEEGGDGGGSVPDDRDDQ
jgi:hypothetical protein